MEKFIKILIASTLFFLFNTFILQLSWAYEKEIKTLSSALSDGIAQSGKRAIAVVDFTDLQGNVTELGRFLAEEISGDLTTSGRRFEVIDRTHLKTILEEHKLSMLGLVDPKNIKKVGQITGADVLVTGSITPFGDSIRITCKAISTETARIFASAKGDIPKTKAIEELMARGIGTSPPSAQAPTSTSSPPPATSISLQAKKIGDLVIMAKKITISGRQVNIALDVSNNSNKKLIFGGSRYDASPVLADDKGTAFNFKEGICRVSRPGELGFEKEFIDSCMTLMPKSSNDALISFHVLESSVRGSIFSFSMPFMLMDKDKNEITKHNVSFMDLKANVPR